MEIKNTTVMDFLSEDNPFIIKEIALSEKSLRPLKTSGGGILLCTSGEGEIAIETRKHTVATGCEIFLLDECTLFIKRCSDDFRIRLFLYSKEIAFQATHKFAPAFFNHIIQHPVYRHNDGCQDTTLSYFTILNSLQNDSRNRFSTIIATNLLRSMMLNIYDKIQRKAASKEIISYARKEELFNRFMVLINEHGRQHRDVAFYAERLCISTRYLGEITKEITKESPKQIIDQHIISEIKLLLTFSDMTIQQIAYHLHFPDQSYLGRFFKHYTGISPLAYRKQEMPI